MKKLLIGLLVFIVVALAGVKIADYVVMGGEDTMYRLRQMVQKQYPKQTLDKKQLTIDISCLVIRKRVRKKN